MASLVRRFKGSPKRFLPLVGVVLLATFGCGSNVTDKEGATEIEQRDPQTAQILDNYLSAYRSQHDRLRGVQMDIKIDAKLPGLEKQGTLWALRKISRLGQITYNALRFSGDNTVKKDVIARYLQAEKEAQFEETGSLAITPANYRFKYRGLWNIDGRQVQVFQLTPRRKMVGLFKGDLWIDAKTYLPIRESGRFIKNPSVFLKRVEFVRDFRIQDGLAIPSHIESQIDTRVFGRAELSISFSNFAWEESADTVAMPAQSQ